MIFIDFGLFAHTAKYLAAEVIMMANFGKVFYQTFTNVFSLRFRVF